MHCDEPIDSGDSTGFGGPMGFGQYHGCCDTMAHGLRRLAMRRFCCGFPNAQSPDFARTCSDMYQRLEDPQDNNHMHRAGPW